MKKKASKLITAFLLPVMAVVALAPTASAVAAPYTSYSYNSSGTAVQAPDVYQPDGVVGGATLGVGDFAAPADIYTQGNMLYILDAGNSRVVRYDTESEKAEEIFITEGENTAELKKAEGIYVTDGVIYVADTGNQCVWCTDENGTVFKKITKPDSEYFSDTVEFLPRKITGDSVGNIYVQCTGVYEGLVIFDSEYAFNGFFGSERVQTTSQVLQSYFWKKLMTKEQREAMANYVPNEINNMDMSADNFLYTLTLGTAATKGYKSTPDSIRCLNPKGSDILDDSSSSKADQAFEADSRYYNFVDIVYSEDGFINVIDNRKGRICQFDENMRLVTAFGGIGDYAGTFQAPCAIETVNGRIAVLDSQKGNITFFSLTSTGENIHRALMLYNSGDYTASLEPWLKVIKENPEFQLAYIGIGNALFNEGEYKRAMEYYELGKYSEGYGNAWREYRVEAMRSGYLIIAAVIAVLVAAAVALKLYRAKKGPRIKKPMREYSGMRLMFYSVFHPFNGFDEMRTKKKGSVWYAFIVIAMLTLLGVAEQQYYGKSFVVPEEGKTNIISIAALRIALILLFVISNWAFSVLLDGKASFVQIWRFTSISVTPYILAGFVRVLLSHFLASNEGVFLTVILAVGVLWSFALLMAAFSVFHEYEIGKSIIIFIVTVIGMLLIAVLAFLMYSLVQNVLQTAQTVFNEAIFRANS